MDTFAHERAKPREIRSAANALVKVFRRALKEGLTRDGWLAIEGPHFIEEAMKPGSRGAIRSLLVAEDAAEKYRALMASLGAVAPAGARRLTERDARVGGHRPPLQADVEIAQVSERLFRQVAQTEAPQGVAALAELEAADLDTILAAREALVLVACGVQDPGNLGTMLRSAQALGATALVTLRQTVSPFNPKAVRASAGAIFHLPVVASVEAGEFFGRAKEKRIRLIAAEGESPSSLFDADLRGPFALLIGREGSGLEPEIARQTDLALSIPIRPASDSLNASAAAAIFLYEAARQRTFDR